MGNDVKRYITCVELPTNLPDVVVGAADYAALEAECERLRGEACELNQRREALALRVLGAEQERDALAAELQAARGLLERITTACTLDAYGSSLHDARAFLDAAPPAAQDVSGLAAFAIDLIDGALQGGNFDGGEIQALGVKHGLLRVEHRTESCGEHCACAEFGFPSECYRLVKSIARQAQQQEVE